MQFQSKHTSRTLAHPSTQGKGCSEGIGLKKDLCRTLMLKNFFSSTFQSNRVCGVFFFLLVNCLLIQSTLIIKATESDFYGSVDHVLTHVVV